MDKRRMMVPLAGLLIGTAASADNSLTVYATVDAGLQSLTKDRFGKAQTTFQDSPATSNRFGMRGAIDIAPGWQAIANLEGRYFLNGNGPPAQYTSNGNVINRLFDRGANIGVAGPYGEFRLGLLTNPVIAAHVAGDVRPAANSGGGIFGWFRARQYTSACVDGTCDFSYLQHALTWKSPSFAGLSGSAFYVFGTGNRDAETTGNENNGGYGAALGYASGPLFANAGAQEMKDQTGTTIGRTVVLNGGYTLGPWTAKLSTAQFRQLAGGELVRLNNRVTTGGPPTVASADLTDRLHSLGLTYAPSPRWKFTAAGYALRRKGDASQDIDMATLTADYAFNKWVGAYVIATHVKNGSAASQSAGYYSLSTIPGAANSALTIGVRAAFDATFTFTKPGAY